MGLKNKIVNALHERAERNKYLNQEKKKIDRSVRSKEDATYLSSYREKRLTEAEERGRRRAQGGRFNIPQVSGERVRGTGNAAINGLKFLNGSGDMFGGMSGGNDISANLQDLIGFGGPAKRSTVKLPKAKRTTITSGGKRITISDTMAEGEVASRKREKSISDNIEDLLKF